jgi:hypothetical protein
MAEVEAPATSAATDKKPGSTLETDLTKYKVSKKKKLDQALNYERAY